MSLTIVTVAEPSPPPVRPDAPRHRRHGPEEDADAYAARLGELWKDAAAEVNTEVVYDPISPADGVRTYLDRHPAGLVAVTTHAGPGSDGSCWAPTPPTSSTPRPPRPSSSP